MMHEGSILRYEVDKQCETLTNKKGERERESKA
jgi:hypothetical protein